MVGNLHDAKIQKQIVYGLERYQGQAQRDEYICKQMSYKRKAQDNLELQSRTTRASLGSFFFPEVDMNS